jgi:hypothetical protein
MLALELESSLRSVVEAWRDHTLERLVLEGIELSDLALTRSLDVQEKDGRGPEAGFHPVDGQTREDAIVLGTVSSSIEWWAGLWVNSSGLQDHVILDGGRRSTKGGAFGAFLRQRHEQAIARGERSDLVMTDVER